MPPDERAVMVRPEPDALERRVAQLEALNAVWTALSSTLELPDLLDLIFRHLNRVLPFDSASILLREGDRFRVARAEGYPEGFPAAYGADMTRFPTSQRLFHERRPLVISDTAQAALWQPLPETAYIRSWIGVPLIAHDEVLGVLNLDSRTPNAYSEIDADLAFAFGQQAAAAVSNARRYDQALARANRLAALYQIGLAISRPDVDEVMRLVHAQISELMVASTFFIGLYDAETEELHFRFVYDQGQMVEPFTRKVEGTVVGWVVEHRQSVVILDTERQQPPVPFVVYAGGMPRAVVIVPMIAGGQPVGVLSVQSYEPDAFSDEDVLVIEAVASQTAVAIRNAQLFDETTRRLAALEALQKTSLSLTTAPDPAATLENIAQVALDLIGSDALCIAIADDAGAPQRQVRADRLAAVFQTGGPSEACAGDELPAIQERAAAEVIRTTEALIIGDVRAHPLFAGDDYAGAVAAFPMKRMGRVMGVFCAGYQSPRRFRDEDVRLLRLLADQAAIALENARNYQETQDRLRERTALYELAQQTTSSLELEAVLQRVVATLRQVFGTRGASIALVDEATNEVVIRSAVGIAQHWQEVARLKVGEGVSGKVVETGESIYVPDTYADPDFIFFDRNVRSLMVVPLRAHDHVIGTLALDSDHPHAFTERHEHLLTIAAAQVAVAIENARLYEALRERAEMLQATNEKLEAAYADLQALDRLRNEMVANVTHELRRPLTFLKGYIGLIRDGELGPVTPEQVEALNIINEKSDSVARLISDILTLERISPGTLQWGRHDLNELAARAVFTAQVSLVADGRNLTITHESPPGAVPIRVDRDRINQVIENLINNAVKYTPDGGAITVTVHPPAPGEAFARLSVRDTGIGIPADELPHVFEKFFQVDPTAPYQQGGAGLGLAIVQRIVEAHDGRVWAESEVGSGSLFTFTVPVFDDDDPTGAPPDAA